MLFLHWCLLSCLSHRVLADIQSQCQTVQIPALLIWYEFGLSMACKQLHFFKQWKADEGWFIQVFHLLWTTNRIQEMFSSFEDVANWKEHLCIKLTGRLGLSIPAGWGSRTRLSGSVCFSIFSTLLFSTFTSSSSSNTSSIAFSSCSFPFQDIWGREEKRQKCGWGQGETIREKTGWGWGYIKIDEDWVELPGLSQCFGTKINHLFTVNMLSCSHTTKPHGIQVHTHPLMI